jgi:hypothetical protein
LRFIAAALRSAKPSRRGFGGSTSTCRLLCLGLDARGLRLSLADASEPLLCYRRFLLGDRAGHVAVEIDPPCPGPLHSQVVDAGGVDSQYDAQLLRIDLRAERGEDVTVNAKLKRPAPAFVLKEGFGNAVQSRAMIASSLSCVRMADSSVQQAEPGTTTAMNTAPA